MNSQQNICSDMSVDIQYFLHRLIYILHVQLYFK